MAADVAGLHQRQANRQAEAFHDKTLTPWAPARAKIGARLDLLATPFRGARHLAQVEIRRGD